jgi:acetyltransferase
MMAIDAVFRPRNIAVLGASADPSKYGYRLVHNLRGGYRGDVYPISRSASALCEYKTYPSLRDVPREVDLVLISIPAQHVAAGIEDAVEISAKAAIIFTAGFQEVGKEGRRLQDDVLRRSLGRIRLVGPNCLGVQNFHYPMNASPMAATKLGAGPIAFVSQSGAFGNAAQIALQDARVGLSKLASIGNMADLTHANLFRYFADDADTRVISAFIEGVGDVPDFLDAIAEVSRKKPIVILKGGRSKSGQRAALSHTGSLAGDGRVWDSLLREAGALVAESSQELFDVAAGLARCERMPRGTRAAIFSLAGGPSVVAADHCDEEGIELPDLEPALQSLRSIVPPYATLNNPVEVTGNTKREHLHVCVDTVASQPNIDAVVAIAIGLDIPEFAEALIAANDLKPVVSCLVAPNCEAMLAASGIPNYPSVDRAVRVLRHLMSYGAFSSMPRTAAKHEFVPQHRLRTGTHSEADSKTYLAGYGLPITREEVVADADAAVAAAQRIGFPVALKVSSDLVIHKTDAGGVILNLQDVVSVRHAARSLGERFKDSALLVQRMVPAGLELIIGGQRTKATGAVIMLGFGGIFAEVLDDVVFCRAPASVEAVEAALGRLRSQRLLNGFRGAQPVDRRAICDIAVRLSEILAANSSISEIDLNPMICSADGGIIVDALIRVGEQSEELA